MPKHDVLVIGAGLAGQRAALAAAEEGVSVGIVSRFTPCARTRTPPRAGSTPRSSAEDYLGVTHLRHGQGIGLPGRPGRDRDHVPGGAGGDPRPRASRGDLPRNEEGRHCSGVAASAMNRSMSARRPASSTTRSGTSLRCSSSRSGGTDASISAMSASSSAGLRLGAGLGLAVGAGTGVATALVGAGVVTGEAVGVATPHAAKTRMAATAVARVVGAWARGRSGREVPRGSGIAEWYGGESGFPASRRCRFLHRLRSRT